MTNVTPALLKKITKGRIFSMEYLRVDGTMGKMTCRFGVTKGLKNHDGEQREAARPGSDNYVTVYNTQKKAWRRIIISNILAVSFQGVTVDLATLTVAANCELLSDKLVLDTSNASYHLVHPRLDKALADVVGILGQYQIQVQVA